MGNKELTRAKKAKNDEFYTLYSDIEKEMTLHKSYLKDKIVYCPCDDWEKSEFVHFFLDNYDNFELRGLIATSYAYKGEKEVSRKEDKKGKVLIKTFDDVHYGFLEGDGDFRSDECTSFRDKADIIITNPPFSLFREFFAWVKDKEVELVAPLSCVTYKGFFPFFMERKLKVGSKFNYFIGPEGNLINIGSAYWISSFDYNIPPLTLTESYSPEKYPKYDNYDAIEVGKVKDIPKDYFGTMGVPITFLKKWNTSQFEIIGIAKESAGDPTLKTKIYTEKDFPSYKALFLGVLNSCPVLKENGEYRTLFARILIRRKEVQI